MAARLRPPHDRDALAHALLTPALGLDAAALATLLRDEDAWDTTLEHFAHYHALWQRHGVLAAVRALMHDFGVAARLLARPADHRAPARGRWRTCCTWPNGCNRPHAREAAAGWRRRWMPPGAAGGCRPSPAGDDPTLTGVERRLDGTPQAIPVITVHKAKGLQFPIVLLPFAGRARPLDDKYNRPRVLRWHDDAGHAHVTLPDEGEAVAAGARARRARTPAGRQPQALRGADARGAPDLGRRGAGAGSRIQRAGAAARAAGGGRRHAGRADSNAAGRGGGGQRRRHRLHRAGRRQDRPYHPASTPAVMPTRPAAWAHVARPRRGPSWWIASYSALARAAHEAPAGADAATEAHVGDDDPGASAPDATGLRDEAPATAPWHRWPRGAQPGVALHALLETCQRHGWPRAPRMPCSRWRRARCRDSAGRPSACRPTPGTWRAGRMRSATPPLPLPGSAGVRLRDLRTPSRRYPFWLRIDAAAEARALDRLLLAHVAPGQPRPALAAVTLHGMLKGFMDLVFEHDGRYWVLDHKSNALGPDDAAYHAG